MLKTFKYRLYPTKRQIHLLDEQLEECRWLWNTLLAERKQAWEERQETVDYYDQKAELPVLKAGERPTLKIVHSQVAQDVVLRLRKAFDAFFRRLKSGEDPGYPRFRGKGRYTSLTYPQWENGVSLSGNDKHLILSKIGNIKIISHRPLEGTPKTVTITRTATGKWFAAISCGWTPKALPPTNHEVGIDVGLKTFATCSDGVEVANPRFFREEEKALAKAQRKHQVALDAHKAKRAEVTKQIKHEHPEIADADRWTALRQNAEEQMTYRAREKRRKVVARTHERITWRRDDFTHQHSRRIVNACDVIAREDLNIRNMVQNHALAKSIHDVAWGQFAELIACKAAWAGRQFIAVNPAYTSADCSGCGHRKTDLTLSDRIYHCIACGLVIDRDLNAALNILACGRACLGLVP
jgi:putative transposase